MNLIDQNKLAWDKKVAVHVESKMYDHSSFLNGRNSLPQLDQDLLGNINGLSVCHLQCHFGQDTISMSRMGAKATGVDFSQEAVEFGSRTALNLGLDTRFVHSDVYSISEKLSGPFDIVYTSYGALCWLDRLDLWAREIDRILKPGGKLIVVEFHPFIYTYDNSLQKLEYDYFQSDAIIEQEQGTYADREDKNQYTMATWNHALGEIFGALNNVGLRIVDFKEYDYSPYNCFENMVEHLPGRFSFGHIKIRIPMMYSLQCKK